MNSFLLLFNNGLPEILQTPITLGILIITILTSYRTMNDPVAKYKLMFNAHHIQHNNEWYRFWSAGLIHGDWMHLIFNMFVLFEFGRIVEMLYTMHFGKLGAVLYLCLYGLGLAASSLFSFFKHRNHEYYNALGASGAVSAVVFAYILFLPTAGLTFIFFPFVEIPAIVLGVLYLGYSQYMSRKGTDNIGHDAHFWGAIWGFAFTVLLSPRLLEMFYLQITHALGY